METLYTIEKNGAEKLTLPKIAPTAMNRSVDMPKLNVNWEDYPINLPSLVDIEK